MIENEISKSKQLILIQQVYYVKYLLCDKHYDIICVELRIS